MKTDPTTSPSETLAWAGSESELSSAQRRYRELFENIGAGICRTTAGPEGTFVEVNPAMVKLLEADNREQLLALHPSQIYQDETQRSIVSARIVSEGVIEEDLALRTLKGRPILCRVTSRKTTDESGRIFFDEIMEDITERKQAEEELRGSEARFRALAESSPLAIFVNRDDRVFLANPSCLKLFKASSPEELIGKPALELFDPDSRSLVRERIRVDSEEVPLVEVRILRLDGTAVDVEATASPFLDQGVKAIQVLLRDITERKQAEEDRLESRLNRRANRAKTEFLSNMSHELRTPLNAILGFGQLLEMREQTPGDQEAVGQILTAGRHLLNLIDETLDIARIDAGRQSFSVEPVDLDKLMDEARRLVAPTAAEKDIDLRAESPSGTIVMADRQRLLQVMLNLLSNAVKYNHRHGSVTIVCEPGPQTTSVKVIDTGPGIPPDKTSKLFTPFERLGAEATTVQGTGLGLALSKSLVEGMGGEIGASSEPEVGTTFWFHLPTATEAPPEKAPDASKALASLPTGPANILYIEDNLSNLQLLEHVFDGRPQYSLVSAMSGSVGVELARSARPGVILLDLHLPDMSGEEVLARLKADPQTKDIPVIVVSADAFPETAERVMSAGASFYVTKPLDLREFLGALSKVLTS